MIVDDEGAEHFVFDEIPRLNAVSLLPQMQVDRQNHASQALGGKLYVIGGSNRTGVLS